MASKGVGFDSVTGATGDGILIGNGIDTVSGGGGKLRATNHATKGAWQVENGTTLKPESTSAFILPQVGAGAPSHSAPEGTMYWDSTNNKFYCNNNGSTGWTEIGAGGGGAPADATYLVTTADGTLSNEVVVGTTPGGELGGTWASPTVDATHSGSSHAGVISTHEAAGDPHTGYRLESADHSHASTGAQGGQVSHADLTNLTSGDPHTQYQREGQRYELLFDDADPSGEANGNLMARSDLLSLALYANGVWLPDWMVPRIFDDFIYGTVGKMPWETAAIGTGTLQFLPGESDHPGILNFDGNDSNAGYAIHRGLDSVIPSDGMFCAVLARFDSTAAAQFVSFGLGDSVTTTNDLDCIGFRITGATAIQGACRNNNSESLTSSTFTFSANTWNWYVWYWEPGASGPTFVVTDANGANAVALGTVTSNVPSARACGPMIRWYTTNNTDKTMDVGAYVLGALVPVTPLRQT